MVKDSLLDDDFSLWGVACCLLVVLDCTLFGIHIWALDIEFFGGLV